MRQYLRLLVLFETLSVTFAPRASARALASGRVIVSSVPVNTSVLLAISLLAACARRRHYLATRHGIVPLMARLRGIGRPDG